MYMYYTSKAIPKALISISVMSFIAGAWFTGSRQIVAVLAFSIITCYLYYICKEKKSKALLNSSHTTPYRRCGY